MRILEIVSHSEEQTFALAEKLSPSFTASDILILTGPLGSGKTVFVRGLARARGIEEGSVTSPTFAFVHEYQGKNPIYHFDLYRIEDPEQLHEIGWDEYLNRDGLVVVEWGEKAEELLPDRYYHLRFSSKTENEREIAVSLIEGSSVKNA